MAIRAPAGRIRPQGMEMGTAPANGGMVTSPGFPAMTKRRHRRPDYINRRDERGDVVGIARVVGLAP